MPNDWFHYIPQQWVGILALVWFFVAASTKFVEKYEAFAKLLPFGKWWHERQKRIEERARPTHDVEALERRIESLAKTSKKQDEAIEELQNHVSVFTAWSIYDARWHHRASVINAERDACKLPRHYDFFEFERVWKTDPLAAARLSYLEETLEGPK
ncbi:hypothetical protein [Mycobacterium asiaticum]|uniref:Minor tail protein n=1 Tax=Mycobacterium asiaticum TaxID=1790 RepID=A0A1A3MW24_MYCAS|nr:hypothetical protein [Mycobacterium asiaticum]OBK14103.1 hypothetical protein A5635_10445 [Mycobacterium asiaticum]